MRVTRRTRFAVSLAAIVTLSALDHAGIFGLHKSDRDRYQNAVATVVHVVDGDTFDIDIPDEHTPNTRIRLWGVDCPEVAHRPEESDAWFGRTAADFVHEHLEGRRVRIALDPNRPTRDKYGRLLAYVYFESTEEMLNEVLLQEGLAYADRRFSHIYALRFRNLEQRASKARCGLWESEHSAQMPAWRQRMLNAGFLRNH